MKKEDQKFLIETIFLAKQFLSSLPDCWLNHSLGDTKALNDFYINVAKIEAEQEQEQEQKSKNV